MVSTFELWATGVKMTRRLSQVDISNFSGGLHSNAAITELDNNEAYDLSNVLIGPNGSFVRSKNGNTVFNSSAMNGGVAVQSLSYYKLVAGTEFLASVCGAKIFSSPLDGTMTDRTGAVTITAGQDNLWTFLTFNNIHIGFGGPSTAPDAPIQWTGAGNAAALAGTPPSAYGAVLANNRVFAFRTAAAPSIVQWSKLGDGQDWTATGSGSQSVLTANNDSITALSVLDTNTILVFKESSIHKMLISTLVSGAFPVFSLFPGTGCAGKHAQVVVDGICYFITPQGFMKITDGNEIIDDVKLPKLSYIDNIWSGINPSRFKYIQGYHVTGTDYEHILWIITSTAAGTTNDMAIRWDIQNKCWLRDKTGYKANAITSTPAGIIYTGHYDGKIYKQDVSGTTTEASESAANVDSYWLSGWQKFGVIDTFKSIVDSYLSFVTQSLGTILFSWGYDFNSLQRSISIDQKTNGGIIGQFIIGMGLIGGQTDKIIKVAPIGNGRVFQYRLRNSDSKMKINSLNLLGKKISKE